ncbi:hypothetical protein Tco_0092099 [Tanacetum coccineum]
MQNTVSCVTTTQFKPKVTAPGKYALDVEPIPPRNRNNREVHLVYLRHLKESVDTLRDIVEEAKAERPLDSSLEFACRYTKHSQELLEYVFGTCPKGWIKHMDGDSSRLMNFVRKCSSGQLGLGHNLFSVGQFCDSDLEVAFRKHSCYVRDTEGVELLKGSRGSNLYTISVEDMMKSPDLLAIRPPKQSLVMASR